MDEILTILSEECAEVIHASSKMQRFGVNDSKNQKILEDELGDLLAMVLILDYYGVVSQSNLAKKAKRKLQKLKRYSDIKGLEELIKEL
jgi:NTP pyrophosphatase (non-canonical NTP hydrolase)